MRTFFAGATTMAATLAAIFALIGAREPVRHERFDEITVGRINIVEPDGTKRLVISNRAQFPGDFIQGKERPRPDRRDYAGMLFVNEEGTENGGLIQRGGMGPDGKIVSGLSLTFDRFRQDQTLQLLNHDSANHQLTGIRVNDVPYFKVTSMEDLDRFQVESNNLPAAEQDAYWKKLAEDGRLSAPRIWLGNTRDKGSSLQLKDAKGRTRMMLLVSAAGHAEITMLDENGKVIKTVSPTN
ncbi:hypothetical protein [Undibacterium fentianense]|nr:hypothetical protein [Undibacterium fentianense]